MFCWLEQKFQSQSHVERHVKRGEKVEKIQFGDDGKWKVGEQLSRIFVQPDQQNFCPLLLWKIVYLLNNYELNCLRVIYQVLLI